MFEELKKHHEERFRAVTESATDAIISVDAKGDVILWNKAAQKIFSYTSEEAISKPLNIIMPERYCDAHQKGIERVISTGKSNIIGKTVEVYGRRKDGREFPIELSLSMWQLDNNIFFTGIVRDITDRKHSEEVIIKAKEELENRVQERTTELKIINERLLAELKERQRTEEALENSLKNLQKSLEGILNALSITTEKKDLYTAGHQQRVSQLSCAIARDLGLSEEKIGVIRIAAMLHDIGKITIPAEILSKPSKLNFYELGIVKSHPQTGYDILKNIAFPWSVSMAILQHHEKLDGSGYPQGLAGEKIFLEARILTIADVVEAMASHRPYRPALGIEKALDEIANNKGISYDPFIIEICIKLFREKRFTFE